jgi:hypothetical protein
MCKPWLTPRAGYPELERLRRIMRAEAPVLYRALAGLYLGPVFRRRAYCPRCGAVAPPKFVGELHRHGPGRKSAAYVARMVRVPLFPVEPRHVDEAVAWLDERWRDPGPYLPNELLPLVSAA